MNESDLTTALHGLGIHETNGDLLLLLPLVQVAWADGEVQAAEKERIVDVAVSQGWVTTETRPMLESWLCYRPSPSYFSQGNQVLRTLISSQPQRTHGGTIGLLALCESVAEAAGGFLGMRCIDDSERNVLSDLVDALNSSTTSIDLLESAADEWADDDRTDVSGFRVTEGRPPIHARQPGPALRVTDNPHLDQRLTGRGIGVGRQRDNDIQFVDDSQVSRRHCRVHLQEGKWTLTDCGSTHGTWVDGERVLSRPLFGDEQIQVGNHLLRFEA